MKIPNRGLNTHSLHKIDQPNVVCFPDSLVCKNDISWFDDLQVRQDTLARERNRAAVLHSGRIEVLGSQACLLRIHRGSRSQEREDEVPERLLVCRGQIGVQRLYTSEAQLL